MPAFPFPLLGDGSSLSDSVSELVSGLVMGGVGAEITAGGRGGGMMGEGERGFNRGDVTFDNGTVESMITD